MTIAPRSLTHLLRAPCAWVALALTTSATGAPIFTSQPTTTLGTPDTDVMLTVAVSGNGPVSYEWFCDNRLIPGEDTAQLTVPASLVPRGHLFQARATDADGIAWSQLALVSVPCLPLLESHAALDPVYASVNAHLDATVTALSRGLARLAISTDGTLVPLGFVRSEQPPSIFPVAGSPAEYLPPSAPILPVIQTATRTLLSVALHPDGSVTTWRSFNDQTNAGEILPSHALSQPSRTVSQSETETLVILQDGSLSSWQTTSGTPASPPSGTDFIDVRSGRAHHLALRSDGTVVAWGDDTFGQVSGAPSLSDVLLIACGDDFCLALNEAGQIHAWGRNHAGQCDVPPLASPPEAIVAGGSIAGVHFAEGSARFWGGYASPSTVDPAVRNITQAGIAAAHLGPAAPVLLRPLDDPVFTVGGPSGAVGGGHTVTFSVENDDWKPRSTFQWLRNGAAILNAKHDTLVLTEFSPAQTGDCACEVTVADRTTRSSPHTLTLAPGPVVSQDLPSLLAIESSGSFTLEIQATGTPALEYEWRKDGRTLPGTAGPTLSRSNADFDDAGDYQVILSDVDGTTRSRVCRVRMIGGSTFFELTGLGGCRVSSGAFVDAVRTSPTTRAILDPSGAADYHNDLPPLQNIVDLSSRRQRWAALRSDGSVREFLFEAGTFEDRRTLQGAPYEAVALGGYHALALHRDGTVSGWRAIPYSAPDPPGYVTPDTVYPPDLSNSHGQLDIPSGLGEVIQVAAGHRHNVALQRDGTVAGWGDNSVGQCDVPPDLSDVRQVVASDNYSMALRENGTVVFWGQAASPAPAPRHGIPPIHLTTSNPQSIDSSIMSIVGGGGLPYAITEISDPIQSPFPSPGPAPAGTPSLVKVFAEGPMAMGVCSDGTIASWLSGHSLTHLVPPELAAVVHLTPHRFLWWNGSLDNMTSAAVSCHALRAAGPPTPGLFSGDRVLFPGFNAQAALGTFGGYPTPMFQWLRDGASSSVPPWSQLHLDDSATQDGSALTGAWTLRALNSHGLAEGPPILITVGAGITFNDWLTSNFTPQEIASGLLAPGYRPAGGPTLLELYAAGGGIDPAARLATILSNDGAPGIPGTSGLRGIYFDVRPNLADVRVTVDWSSNLIGWAPEELGRHHAVTLPGGMRRLFVPLPETLRHASSVFSRLQFRPVSPRTAPTIW